jgi:hypothetical protein
VYLLHEDKVVAHSTTRNLKWLLPLSFLSFSVHHS